MKTPAEFELQFYILHEESPNRKGCWECRHCGELTYEALTKNVLHLPRCHAKQAIAAYRELHEAHARVQLENAALRTLAVMDDATSLEAAGLLHTKRKAVESEGAK
jgi:phage terminase large subunit GpA-like protein